MKRLTLFLLVVAVALATIQYKLYAQEDAGAYYNRGLEKYKLGDYKGAIADYDKAIELDPKFAKAYNNRGFAKAKLGDYKGAIADLEKAIDLDPSLKDTVQPEIDKIKEKLK